MKWKFDNSKLETLYETGTSKKYRLPEQVLKNFYKVIRHIEAAVDIYDFWNTSSIKFEKLKRSTNSYSFRLNKQYRLEVEIDWNNRELTIGEIIIIDISKHYGD